MINNNIMKNRTKLLKMMAACEDITRTNNRIYSILETLMNNPGDKTNLDKSIEDLLLKVTNLKGEELEPQFIDTDDVVVVPTREDASPKKDPDFNSLVQPTPINMDAVTPEEEEHNEALEESTNTPQPTDETLQKATDIKSKTPPTRYQRPNDRGSRKKPMGNLGNTQKN